MATLHKDQVEFALYTVGVHARAWKTAWIQREPDPERLQALREDYARRVAPQCARLPLETLKNMALLLKAAVDELEDTGKCPAVDTTGLDTIAGALAVAMEREGEE